MPNSMDYSAAKEISFKAQQERLDSAADLLDDLFRRRSESLSASEVILLADAHIRLAREMRERSVPGNT